MADRAYVDQAHAMGLEVWVLVDNFNPDVSTTEVLKNQASRGFIIAQLMQALQIMDLMESILTLSSWERKHPAIIFSSLEN